MQMEDKLDTKIRIEHISRPPRELVDALAKVWLSDAEQRVSASIWGYVIHRYEAHAHSSRAAPSTALPLRRIESAGPRPPLN